MSFQSSIDSKSPTLDASSSNATASADSFFQSLNNNDPSLVQDFSPSAFPKSKNQDNIPVKLDIKSNNNNNNNNTTTSTFDSPSSASSSSSSSPSTSLSIQQQQLARANRRRSNSKSRRQINPIPPSFSPGPSHLSSANSSNSSHSALPRTKIDRSQVQYNLILTSLNGTFEKKSLIIPYHPDVLKLGRPAGTKVQPTPTNGYFDSRVLSRNHAQLFADMNTGQVYLKDLGSSNGTFVNGKKIASEKDSEPTEIKKGDVIDLGFDIESHQNHRKISAKVENIIIRPLTSNSKSLITNIINNSDDTTANVSLFEIENDVKNSILSNSFDSALFGDILPNFEDNVLNIKNDSMTGLSINSNLTTSSNLDFQIKTLINEIYLTKNSILKIKSVEAFLKKYIKNLKKIEIEKNEASKNKVKDYEQQLAKKFENELHQKQKDYEKKFAKLTDNYKQIKNENEILAQSSSELHKQETLLKTELDTAKKEKQELTTENNTLKNDIESKIHELNDWKIKFTELEAKIQEYQTKAPLVDKNLQTDPIILKKYNKKDLCALNDNDSDSSTLNEDDINLQKLAKSLNARSNEYSSDSSHLKKSVNNNNVITNNEQQADLEKMNANTNDALENQKDEDDNLKKSITTGIPTVHSDEDLNSMSSRNNIITDEKAISDDDGGLPSPTVDRDANIQLSTSKTGESSNFQGTANEKDSHNDGLTHEKTGLLDFNKESPLNISIADGFDSRPLHNKEQQSGEDSRKQIHHNHSHNHNEKKKLLEGENDFANDELLLKYNELLEKFEKLEIENSSIKNHIGIRDEKIGFLEEQIQNASRHDFSSNGLPYEEHIKSPINNSQWLEGSDSVLSRRGTLSNNFSNPLTRTPSNVSTNSVSSRNIPLSPLFGIFSPTLSHINRLRSKNVSEQELEENFTNIDEDNLDSSKRNSAEFNYNPNGSGMFIKPENTKVSLVTTVGVIIIGMMISKFKG